MTHNTILTTYPQLTHSYNPQLIIKKAKGDYVWDIHGNKYIDFTGGIAVHALGHSHPAVIRNITKQAKKVLHQSNLYTYPASIELCKQLVDTANNEFHRTHTVSHGEATAENSHHDTTHFAASFLCNSGTEANEAALKFTRLYFYRNNMKHKTHFVAFKNSFHGRTMGALSVTGQEKYRSPFEPLLPHCSIVPYNDCTSLQQAVTDQTAAVIFEPIQGEGGLEALTQETATCLQALAKKYSFFIIADEVQTGLYRCGNFFASSLLPLQPDIITLAKALGGGTAGGAVIYSQKIQHILQAGDHGTTLGGNPLTASCGLTVLSLLQQKHIQNKRHISAQSLEKNITILCNTYTHIHPLGKGHLRGIHFSEADTNKNAINTTITSIISECQEKGLLILRTGTHGLRLAPSFLCSPHTIQKAFSILSQSIKKWL